MLGKFIQSKLFQQSIRKRDSEVVKNRIEILNRYILIYSAIFLILAFLVLNKSYTFFFIHSSVFSLLFINIFLRLKLNPFLYSIFICILLTIVFLHINKFGIFFGTGIYFVAILTSLPLFLSWKTQKKYYYVLFCIAALIFITSYFLKLQFYLPDSITVSKYLSNDSLLKSHVYNTILGSIGILVNLYFIREANKISNTSINKNEEISPELLINLIESDNPLFLSEFKKTHPLFVKNLYENHPNISQNEFKFCSLIFLEFSSKEIAYYLNLEYRTIQTKKNKLRRKLKLEAHTDLYTYMKNIEINNTNFQNI